MMKGYKKIKENHVDLQYGLYENDWGIDKKYQIGY